MTPTTTPTTTTPKYQGLREGNIFQHRHLGECRLMTIEDGGSVIVTPTDERPGATLFRLSPPRTPSLFRYTAAAL